MSVTKKALLIGINYTGSQYELNGCINDVKNAKQNLIKNYGYSEANILMLTDETKYKPTRNNIIAGFSWLLSTTSAAQFVGMRSYKGILPPGSRLYVHYSGHGSYIRDLNGDENDGRDEVIVPYGYPRERLISDDEIRSQLCVKVPAKCKLLGIIDSCYSGSSFDLLWSLTSTNKGTWSLTKDGRYTQTAGDVMMLSGCTDKQTSAESFIGGSADGVLTYAFHEVLKQNKYQIGANDLLEQVREYIVKNKLSSQIPCITFGNTQPIDRLFTP